MTANDLQITPTEIRTILVVEEEGRAIDTIKEIVRSSARSKVLTTRAEESVEQGNLGIVLHGEHVTGLGVPWNTLKFTTIQTFPL